MIFESFYCKEEVDLEKTLFSGQIFSFKKINDVFVGNIQNNLFFLKSDSLNEIKYFTKDDDLKTEEKQNILEKFFTLDISYENLQNRIRGLRLLRLEKNETLFSFICSSNNNVKRITNMVQHLNSKGEFILEYEGHKFYKFPDFETISKLENDLKENKFGYRANYIIKTAEKLLELKKEKNFSLNDLENLKFEETRKFLCGLKGIGIKVADCICLMGFYHFDVTPVDVHVFRKAKEIFKLKENRLNEKVANKIRSCFIEKYGKFAGIEQLFLFYSGMSKKI